MTLARLQLERRGFNLYQLQLQCNATFPGDSDIDGDGMLISSITFALITSMVALLNAWTERDMISSLKSWVHAEPPRCRGHEPKAVNITSSRYWLYNFSNKMLSNMCDLQLITGLGIMIATFCGIESFSLYHLNLINSYYWLSITGLWVVGSLSSYEGFRAFGNGSNSDHQSGRLWRKFAWVLKRDVFQRLLIVPSVVLGVVMQIVLFNKVTQEWDYQTSGRCFRDDDQSSWQSTWVWVVDLGLYDVGVVLTFHSKTSRLSDYFEHTLSVLERRCISTFRSLLGRKDVSISGNPLQDHTDRPGSDPSASFSTVPAFCMNFLHQYTSTTLLGLIAFFVLIGAWSLRQTLALCALADGTPLFVAIYCLSFFSWSAYDIIGNKILNKDLITDNTTWGFGQILPLVLMLAVVFNTIDAARSANGKQPEELFAQVRLWPSTITTASLDRKNVDDIIATELEDTSAPSSPAESSRTIEQPLFGLSPYRSADQIEGTKMIQFIQRLSTPQIAKPGYFPL